MQERYQSCLSFWTLSFHYLKLVDAVAEETINQGNRHFVISDTAISPGEYDQMTKWSDFNVIVPILYSFYHGLELLLKGFMILRETGHNPKLDHDIEKLLDEFKANYPDQVCLINVFSKYIGSDVQIEPLSSFFKANGVTANRFYQLLRYPADKKMQKMYKHLTLKYRGEDGVSFCKELQEDLNVLRRCSVSLG